MGHKSTSIHPEDRPNGKVAFAVSIVDVDTLGADQTIYELDYEMAWNLYSNLGSILHRVSEQRMRNAVAGPCDRCGNHRMVYVTVRPGMIAEREELQHCPDCWDRYSAASPAYATLTMRGVREAWEKAHA